MEENKNNQQQQNQFQMGHTEPNAEPEPEPDCSDEGQPKTKRRPDGSWKCMFCDHMNPSGKDYCQKCGAEAFFDQP